MVAPEPRRAEAAVSPTESFCRQRTERHASDGVHPALLDTMPPSTFFAVVGDEEVLAVQIFLDERLKYQLNIMDEATWVGVILQIEDDLSERASKG